MLPLLLLLLLFSFSRGEVDRLSSYLASVNPPSVKNFTLSNGDIVLCVRLEDQLSLAGHKRDLQMKPSAHYLVRREGRRSRRNLQLFAVEVGSCSRGTIPVLYTPAERIRSFGSLDSYLTKVRKYSSPRYRRPGKNILEAQLRHEYAYGYLDGNFTGMQTTINVWRPYVEQSADFTLSQLWITSRKQGSLNTVEAGWQVYPQLYKSQDTRSFIYWTADGYAATGCYNLLCKGFVQVNRLFVLGGSLNPVSTLGSTQYEQTFRIFQDNVTSNWWLRINGLDVGYWPARLFTSLKSGSEVMSLGGEVVSTIGRHTKTQMGSGLFPDKGFKQAAYHRRILYLNSKGNAKPAFNLHYQAENPRCYNTAPALNRGSLWGAAFFFGGPGSNTMCP